MLKDKPFEVWDVPSLSLLALLKASQITALEWCPTPAAASSGITSKFTLMLVQSFCRLIFDIYDRGKGKGGLFVCIS